jgi:uncharacterized protein YmfQ (DUF2313 family)
MNDNDITEEQIKENFVNLIKYVPDFIYNDPSTQPIFLAQGRELGTVRYYIQDLINQCFINTATWALDIWEKEYGIIPNIDDTIETRRSRILAKKKGWQTITVDVIKNICNEFVDQTTIETHNEEYYFKLFLENINKGFINFLQDLIDIIEELKPAHLGVHYELTETTKSNLYLGSVTCNAEIITVYPWTPSNIEVSTNLYIPVSNSSTLETITIYPQNDDTILWAIDDSGNYVTLEFE